MRSASGLLPSALAPPRLSARVWLALAAGVGCAVCAYAGLYPPFDDGKLRLVLALTSAPFGAAVVAAGLSARTASRAFGLTIVLAAVLGMASIMIPAAILMKDEHASYFVACGFGFFFGAPTGALYGIPLAILVACGHRHVRAQTHESTDHAARVAGTGLSLLALVALLAAVGLAHSTTSYAEGVTLEIPPSSVPAIVAVVAILGSMFMLSHGVFRLRGREAWLARVRAGLEPAFRLRPAEPRDGVERLPRVGDGVTVVEWLADDTTAYRMSATGIAIAVID